MRTKKPKPGAAQLPRHILVPIDFSAASKKAVLNATRLASKGSKITLLHVILPETRNGHDRSALIANTEQRLAEFAGKPKQPAAPFTKSVVSIGTPFQEILTTAGAQRADLIVLGIDDSEPFGGLALGHTADRVSRYARCDVLLVREAR